MSSSEYLEIKNLLLEMKNEFRLNLRSMVPSEFSVADLAKKTGLSKPCVLQKLYRFYDEGADYFTRGNKIIIKQECAINIVASYSKAE